MMALAQGLAAGLAATAAMTAFELVPWRRRWGIRGVFEWHENQVLAERYLRARRHKEARNKEENRLHFGWIFLLHFVNGSLGGAGFAVALWLLPLPLPLSLQAPAAVGAAALVAAGLAYGLLLWVLTLAPIHRPITGLHPWRHPHGRGPALASLAEHFVYGATLALAYVFAV